MRYIAHRGNVTGKQNEQENTVPYILKAIELGFDCEIDVWRINGEMILSHDKPVSEMPMRIIPRELWNFRDKLWFHCKNIEALSYLISLDPVPRCFYHDEDDYTLTSDNHIWAYPGAIVTRKTIIVMPEWDIRKHEDAEFRSCAGICSDNITYYKEKYYRND